MLKNTLFFVLSRDGPVSSYLHRSLLHLTGAIKSTTDEPLVGASIVVPIFHRY